MSKTVIVGGVAGGMSAAARLRRLDEKREIVVFEKGEFISYANCGLPYYIGGVITQREKLLIQTEAAFEKRFSVDIRPRSEVIHIDREKKTVTVKDMAGNESYTESYDQLILSPGAEPVRPPLPGIDHPRIFTLRSIPDTDKIKAFIDEKAPKHALIIGAGFIGLEMAENLHKQGIFITIVEIAKQVMNVLDFEMAAQVHQHLKAKKIEFYLEDAVVSFEDSSGRVKVKLKSGIETIVDMVLLSIGVKPEVHLAKEAGLEIGGRGGIAVNDYLQTSDPSIYAVGDAIEVLNPILGKKMLVPLAWPANQQGRIAADNIINGNQIRYKGTIATAIAKVFDITVGVTGATEKQLKAEKISYLTTIVHPSSHASYYPDALQLTIKLLFSPKDGKVLGAQSVGFDGVDKRLDVLAAAILGGHTVYDLTELEHSYAPPYSSAKDPVNMAAFTAENILHDKVKIITWDAIEGLNPEENVILDVRTPEETRSGIIKGAVNIPVDGLRERLQELPKKKKIVVYCRVGLRGYIVARILTQNGFKDVFNLSGGYLTYSAATGKQDNPNYYDESLDTGIRNSSQSVNLNIQSPAKTVELDACGLQCPGPIMRVKTEMDKLSPGDRLEVKATDPGFYNDVPSWVRATNNSILSINIEKGVVHALIEKGQEKLKVEQFTGSRDKTIIVFDGDLDKAIASFIIVNGALSMGRKVTMFFTFWGLNVLRRYKAVKGLKKNLVEKMFGWMLPRGTRKLSLSRMNMGGMGPVMIRGLMKSKNVDALEIMVESAIKNGARLIACQMSMDLIGIKREELIDGVEIGGVATYLEAAEHADTNLFI